jgi:hypothetical protein
MRPSLARRAHGLALAVSAALLLCTSAQAQVMARQAWTDEHFDQWVFQQDRNAAGARKRLDWLLALGIDDIDRACRLTDAQKKKLHLAGKGDVQRFFDRYEAIKQKFQLVKNDEQKMQQIFHDISPLQTSLQAGLFQEDSLLVKSLSNTLTGEQFGRYEARARERRTFHHRAAIERAIAMLEQGMPLRDAQRRQLTALLMDQTKPPRKSGQYEYYLIMFQLGRVPEGKLKPLFDNTQWKVVSRQLDQYKQWEPFLKQSGQWPIEDDDADRGDDKPAALTK